MDLKEFKILLENGQVEESKDLFDDSELSHTTACVWLTKNDCITCDIWADHTVREDEDGAGKTVLESHEVSIHLDDIMFDGDDLWQTETTPDIKEELGKFLAKYFNVELEKTR